MAGRHRRPPAWRRLLTSMVRSRDEARTAALRAEVVALRATVAELRAELAALRSVEVVVAEPAAAEQVVAEGRRDRLGDPADAAGQAGARRPRRRGHRPGRRSRPRLPGPRRGHRRRRAGAGAQPAARGPAGLERARQPPRAPAAGPDGRPRPGARRPTPREAASRSPRRPAPRTAAPPDLRERSRHAGPGRSVPACLQRSRSSAYLSTSPTTKNIEPRIATMSATSVPGSSSVSTCTLLNDADRSLSRHGVFSPRDTR